MLGEIEGLTDWLGLTDGEAEGDADIEIDGLAEGEALCDIDGDVEGDAD